MALVDEIESSPAVWVDSNLQHSNDTGSVIATSELSGTGEVISDIYELTVSNRSGGTGDIAVVTQSKNNPYDATSHVGVNFDDATEYNNIVPGVILTLDNAAVNADVATVIVGQPQGSFDASGVSAGVPTAGVRHRVTNSGASEVADAKARLLTQAVLVVLDHDLFKSVSPFAENAVEKTVGGGSDRVMPYKVEVVAVSGAGPTKEVDIEIDGVAVPSNYIQDITTGLLQDGTGLKAIDPAYYYQFMDGDLEGLIFAIHEDAALNDEANILIFSPRYTQIASDTAGVAGTYGTSDVTLTQSGEASGVIQASAVAYYWSRILVPASSSNESNPHPCSIALQAQEAQDAGWEA